MEVLRVPLFQMDVNERVLLAAICSTIYGGAGEI